MNTKELQPKKLGKAATAVASLALLGSAIASGCGGGSKEGNAAPASPDTGVTPNVPTLSATPNETKPASTLVDGNKGGEQTPVITQSPKVEPTANPTATKPPEQVKEAPCEILPQELCGKAEVLKYKTLKGDEVIMLGFRNLPPGTKIKAISDATVTPGVFAETDVWKGAQALVQLDPEGKKSIVIRGDIAFDSLKQLSVKRGDVITAIKGSGADNFGYNLLFNFVIKENGKFIDNTELLEGLFPGITSKAPVGKLEQTADSVVRSGEYFPEHESAPSGSSTR